MLQSIGIPVGIQSSTDLLHFSEDLWKCGLLSLSPASLFLANHLLTLGVGSNLASGGPSAEMRIKSSNVDTARLTRTLLLIRFWAEIALSHCAAIVHGSLMFSFKKAHLPWNFKCRGEKRLVACWRPVLNFWSPTLNFWSHWRPVSRNVGPWWGKRLKPTCSTCTIKTAAIFFSPTSSTQSF